MDIPNNIKKLMDERGLKQEAVAELTGLSVPYISRLVRGDRPISANALAKLAAAFGVEPHVIIQSNYIIPESSVSFRAEIIENVVFSLQEHERFTGKTPREAADLVLLYCAHLMKHPEGDLGQLISFDEERERRLWGSDDKQRNAGEAS